MKSKYELSRLEKKTGYIFKNQILLKQALTHSSYANELKLSKTEDYERLEFLGDAVLELSVSEYLFYENAGMEEGSLTRTRASLVCEPTLAYCAREMCLQDFIFLGKGEEMTGGRGRDSIVSDVFEALIGAIYLDGGFSSAKEFVRRFVLDDMEHKVLFFDSKTFLQEKMQGAGSAVSYKLLGEIGPEHNREYRVAVCVDGEPFGEGLGRTKKSAEQQAAYQALLKLDKEK